MITCSARPPPKKNARILTNRMTNPLIIIHECLVQIHHFFIGCKINYFFILARILCPRVIKTLVKEAFHVILKGGDFRWIIARVCSNIRKFASFEKRDITYVVCTVLRLKFNLHLRNVPFSRFMISCKLYIWAYRERYDEFFQLDEKRQ